MPSPLDFSALDCLLFPGPTSDIPDRESFLQRQKVAAEAYEENVKLEELCKEEARPCLQQNFSRLG
jgi:hypothetical protein